MNELPEILGILSEDKARALISEETKKMQEENKRRKKKNRIISIFISLICLIMFYVFFKFYNPTIYEVFAAIILGGAGGALFLSGLYDKLFKFKPHEYSIPVQFYFATKNKKLLNIHETEETSSISLVLEDNDTHIVSYDFIFSFKFITRADIGNTIIDLNTGIVYKPYRKELCFS